MKKRNYHLIVDEALTGLENMARDAILLDFVESKRDEIITFLRFYKWLVPTLSIGKNQDIRKAANIEFCRENGIDIVRRPTGGKAVLHHIEITYSVVSNDLSLFGNSLMETYKNISTSLCEGLNSMGIEAEIANKPSEKIDINNFTGVELPCFSSTSQYEIEVKGKKLVGSAQRRLKKSFLQHGSIIYELSYDLQAGAMKVEREILEKTTTSISENISSSLSYEEIVENLVSGFEKAGKVEYIKTTFPEELLSKVPEYTEHFKVSY